MCTIAPAIAQVGIGTSTPKSLLDIPASNQASPSYNDGLLIPRIDAFPDIDPGADQDGMIVFLTTPSGSFNKGFHYWDNTPKKWVAHSGEWTDGLVSQVRGDFNDNLIYANQAGGNGTDVVILDSGQMGIGTSTPEESIELKFEGDNDIQISSVSPPNAPNLIFYTTGGTDFSNRAFLIDDDDIGYVTGKAWTGSGKSSDISNIKMIADGTHSANSYPTKIQFSVTAAGDNTDSTSGMEMTIRSNGDVGIGTEDPTQRLDVAGDVRIRNLTEGTVVSDSSGNLSIGPSIVAAGKVSAAGAAVKINGATVANTGTGTYRVTFTNPRSSANYVIQLSTVRCLSCGAADDSFTVYYTNQTTTYFDVHTGSNDNGTTALNMVNAEFMFSVIDF